MTINPAVSRLVETLSRTRVTPSEARDGMVDCLAAAHLGAAEALAEPVAAVRTLFQRVGVSWEEPTSEGLRRVSACLTVDWLTPPDPDAEQQVYLLWRDLISRATA